MKTIIIERVANGWIVRNFSPCESWARSDADMHVYRTLKELQADLPELLGPDEAANRRTPTMGDRIQNERALTLKNTAEVTASLGSQMAV